jgi:hypothetical protein
MKTKVYVLRHPETKDIRYVGITTKSLEERLRRHLGDVTSRPDLNYHKICWLKSILNKCLLPIIEQIEEFENVEEAKEYEIEYIAKYKKIYDLTNATIGGDMPGLNSHTRETILKKKNIRPIVQYNIYGEFIDKYEITEDAARSLNISSASKITMCARGLRPSSHGYIWRYEGDELGDISFINKNSTTFCYIDQYDLNDKFIKRFESLKEAAIEVGDMSSGGNIYAAAIGLRQQACKGFKWKFEYKFRRGVSLNSLNSVNIEQNAEQGIITVCNDHPERE